MDNNDEQIGEEAAEAAEMENHNPQDDVGLGVWLNDILMEPGAWYKLDMNVLLKAMHMGFVKWTELKRVRNPQTKKMEYVQKEHTLPDSYKRWEKLKASQKDTMLAFWNKLAPEMREQVLVQVKEQMGRVTQAEEAARASTTANEYARLLIIINMPQCVSALTRFRQGLTRQELDMLHSNEQQVADDANPFAVVESFRSCC
jgi:hypothetical protein